MGTSVRVPSSIAAKGERSGKLGVRIRSISRAENVNVKAVGIARASGWGEQTKCNNGDEDVEEER